MRKAERVQRILVVEDDDAIAEPLARGLEREGYAVTRAATGQQALDTTYVDLVLLSRGDLLTEVGYSAFTQPVEASLERSVAILLAHRLRTTL